MSGGEVEFASVRGAEGVGFSEGTAGAEEERRAARELALATARARLELEAGLYPGAARARLGGHGMGQLVGVAALGLFAAGFAIFVGFIFVNLLFHYNPGL